MQSGALLAIAGSSMSEVSAFNLKDMDLRRVDAVELSPAHLLGQSSIIGAWQNCSIYWTILLLTWSFYGFERLTFI